MDRENSEHNPIPIDRSERAPRATNGPSLAERLRRAGDLQAQRVLNRVMADMRRLPEMTPLNSGSQEWQ